MVKQNFKNCCKRQLKIKKRYYLSVTFSIDFWIGVLHSQLCNISKQLNKAYSCHTLLISLHTFVFILNVLFIILTFIVNNNHKLSLHLYLAIANFIFYFLLAIVVITVICSNTEKEAEETNKLLLQLQLPNKSNEQDVEILYISMQMLHNKIQFSPLGLFTVDKRFLYLFLTTILSYAVIILQFDVAVY